MRKLPNDDVKASLEVPHILQKYLVERVLRGI